MKQTKLKPAVVTAPLVNALRSKSNYFFGKGMLLLVLTLYTLLCTFIVWGHTRWLLNWIKFGLLEYGDYWADSRLYLSVQYVPLAAALSGSGAVIAAALLKKSMNVYRKSTSKRLILAVLPPCTLTLVGAMYVMARLPAFVRYTWASQPAIQHKVCVAALCNRPDELQKLLTQGADPDSVLDDTEHAGAGALQMAVFANNVRCVDILLKSGASPEGSGDGFLGGWTPLDQAVYNNNIQMVRKLIDAGADVNNMIGNAVQSAIDHGYTEIVALFFKRGISRQHYERLEEVFAFANNKQALTLLHKYRPKN